MSTSWGIAGDKGPGGSLCPPCWEQWCVKRLGQAAALEWKVMAGPLLEVQEVPSFAHFHCVIRSLLGDAGHASGPVRKHSLFLTVCSGQALSP